MYCHVIRCVLLVLQEELKLLRQQQADYIDQIRHFSHHEAHQSALSSGTRIHNADGKFIIFIYLSLPLAFEV